MSEFIDRCQACNAPIQWQMMLNREMEPVNLDGTRHWLTCPRPGKRKRPRSKEQQLDLFEEKKNVPRS